MEEVEKIGEINGMESNVVQVLKLIDENRGEYENYNGTFHNHSWHQKEDLQRRWNLLSFNLVGVGDE